MLDKKIPEDAETINPEHVADELAGMLKRVYNITFKSGIDVDTYRPGIVFLYALTGLFVGGLIGFGWDTLSTKRSLYGGRED